MPGGYRGQSHRPGWSDAAQRVGDPEPHGPDRGQQARHDAKGCDQRGADGDVASRQHEDGQHPARGIAARDERPGCEQSEPVLSCCDVYGNVGGDWVGCIASQAGVQGNVALDPLFCNRLEEDLRLCSGSPCEPGQSSGCGLIGALGVGCSACGATAVEASTWGRIKAIGLDRRRTPR